MEITPFAMTVKKLFVFAIYSSPLKVEHAINSLLNSDFDPQSMSIWFAQPLNSAKIAAVAPNTAPKSHAPDLVEAGIPAFESKRYEEFIRKGGILVALRCSSSEECERARRIMKGSHADDVSSAREFSAVSAEIWPTPPAE